MSTRRIEPGQPLVALSVLLGAWIVIRTVLWQSPFGERVPAGPQQGEGDAILATLSGPFGEPTASPAAAPVGSLSTAAVDAGADSPPHAAAQDSVSAEPAAAEPLPAPIPALLDPVPAQIEPLPPRSAAGHSLMLMAGFSNLELPPELARYLAPRLRPAPAAVPFRPAMGMAATPETDRWSADAWLLLRKDSTTAVTSGRGSYGQSQLGAVLRYRLLASSAHRPTAYLRASQALAGARESEAALGLAARPVPGVPIVAAAELRLARAGGSAHARPAAYAVTELPPVKLPGGFSAEAYLQAGYVGGDFATGFVDGQVRAERTVFDLGSAELRAGGGVWGGAQKGASRLDIGPSASLRVTIGETPARASMDWRFRVAGDAEPDSGPALTISAGF
jgi:hypothetical protein